jgi:hypothetical protein
LLHRSNPHPQSRAAFVPCLPVSLKDSTPLRLRRGKETA